MASVTQTSNVAQAADAAPGARVAFNAPLELVVETPGAPKAAPAPLPAETQDKVRKLLAGKRNLIPVLEFAEADDGSSLFPGSTSGDFKKMKEASKDASVLETNQQGCCGSSNHYRCVSRMRIALRVIGLTGLAVGQGMQWAGKLVNSEELEVTGMAVSAFCFAGMAGTELYSHCKKENLSVANQANNKLNDLLKTPKENMERNAKSLLRKWVALTEDCEQRELPDQLKDYIVGSWARSLPRIRQIAIAKIGSAAKADELLEPMTSAVRAIELAHTMGKKGVSMDLGDTAVEFEKNRFSSYLAMVQQEFSRKQQTPEEQTPAERTTPPESEAAPADPHSLNLDVSDDRKDASKADRKAGGRKPKKRMTLRQRFYLDYNAARAMGVELSLSRRTVS